MAIICLYEAYDSFVYFAGTKARMTEVGLTFQQDFLLNFAIFVLFLGGILLLTGYRSSFGAILLLIYWVPTTYFAHSFWNDPQNCEIQITCLKRIEMYRRMQAILFMKNLAIIGGLLMVWVNGSGRYSIRRLFATTRVPGN